MGNCSIKTTPVCFEKNCFICYKKITCKKYITCFHCNIVKDNALLLTNFIQNALTVFN